MSLAGERLRELCQHLGLEALAKDFPGLAERSAKDELSYSDFLEMGLRLEVQARQSRSSTLLTRIAGFPAIKTLDEYDFAFATGAPRQLLMDSPPSRSSNERRTSFCSARAASGKRTSRSPLGTRQRRPESRRASSPPSI